MKISHIAVILVAAAAIVAALVDLGSARVSLDGVRRQAMFSGTESACESEAAGDVPWSSFFADVKPGEDVLVPCGNSIYIDEAANIPRLGLLQVDGYLSIPVDLPSRTVEVANILVRGRLEMGNKTEHIQNRFIFRILGSSEKVVLKLSGETVDLGTKVVAVAGGILSLWGMPGGNKCVKKGWARLANPAKKGSNSITLDGNIEACWKVGHEIGIAPSFTTSGDREKRSITKVQGSKVYFDEPLKWDHTGNSDSFTAGNETIPYTTEVGLLTRNIVFSGEVDDLQGMHTIVAMTQRAQSLTGVEIVGGGQQGVTGRYPLHFHMSDQNDGSTVTACSVHKSFQRGIIIHGTDNIEVEDNVVFDVSGHGIGFEDGVEKNNLIQNNLIVGGKRTSKVFKVDGKEESDRRAACVWIRAPGNSIIGNVAAGCWFGYWYELESSVRGPAKYLPQATGMNPQKVKVTKFEYNTARTCIFGLSTYPDGMVLSGLEMNIFSDNFFYSISGTGIFTHNSQNLRIERAIVSDAHLVGIDLDRVKNAEVKNSLIIGKSPSSPTCPSKYGVELHPMRGLTNVLKPSLLDTVAFDMFQDCPKAPISIGNEESDSVGKVNQQQSVPASTSLKRITFFDSPDLMVFLPQTKKDIPRSADSDWTSHVALHVDSSPQLGGGEGFLISSNNEALRPRSKCTMMSGRNSLFCPGVCYRTIEFHIKTTGEKDPGPWRLKLTRLSDDTDDYLENPTWNDLKGDGRVYEFFGNFVGGEEYLVTPLAPPNGRADDYLGVRYDDGEVPACSLGVTIVHSQNLSALSVVQSQNRQPSFERPCPGSNTKITDKDIIFFDRCDPKRGPEVVVVLPYKLPVPDLNVLLLSSDTVANPSCTSGEASKTCS